MRVYDLMTTPVVTIRSDKRLVVVDEVMQWHHIRHIPVIGNDGRLIGIVSHRDLLSAAVSTLAVKIAAAERRQHLAMSEVERIMNRNVISIGPDAPVQEAAALLRTKRVGCLPVVEGGYLLGIVTESDMVRLVEHLPGGALSSVRRPVPRTSAVAIPA
ncbi:MAG TPA: CBS domain-containing protein [Gemmatimonadales bacterium]